MLGLWLAANGAENFGHMAMFLTDAGKIAETAHLGGQGRQQPTPDNAFTYVLANLRAYHFLEKGEARYCLVLNSRIQVTVNSFAQLWLTPQEI